MHVGLFSLVGISLVLAFLASRFIANQWLQNFLYRTHISLWIFDNPDDYMQAIDDSTQQLLISKSAKSLETWITAASAKDQLPGLITSFLV